MPGTGRAGNGGSGKGAPARRADPARRAACDVLCAVTERDAYANLLLPALLRERGLTGRDAALATELTYGTLRGRGSYDAILALCADRALGAIDPPVLEVLRLGAHQLLRTRVKAHAAVATSVNLARQVAGQRPAGFVNAVLRRVAQRDLAAWLAIAAPGRADDPVGYLSVRYSHPRWIVSALRQALGEEAAADLTETEAALAADGSPPAVTLCALPGLADQRQLVAAGAEPARWSPYGAYLPAGNPALLPVVAAGRAWVQDEASQLAALALSRVDAAGGDGRWLDLCAGPGGKARLLAGLAAGQAGRPARLLAADVRLHRARLIVSGWAHADGAISGGGGGGAGVTPGDGDGDGDDAVGPAPRDTAGPAPGTEGAAAPAAVSVIVADGTAPAWRLGAFDRVLADVPCSGLGALRRRPEARWRRSPADVAELSGLQRRLLAAALDSARPGGVVGYVTCSPHVGETREVIAAVLSSRADVAVLDAPAVLAEVPGLACPEPDGRYAQFWPHRHGTDAIFLALLRRTAAPGR